ncbi:MAG TPA: SCP2 sterol-binding domain-containing protein [Ilumatobacteraceae bacterium]|nr:SCP2 sterol-binding domain-containing protein [Ilumatobacteraceae bacterium]
MRYLSLEWIEAVAAEAAVSDAVRDAAEECTVGVTQVVTDGPEGTVIYSLQSSGDGAFTFTAGQAFPEDVRFQQTWETAVGVATGALNAQEAFIQGRILLTGDQQKLMDSQPVFAALSPIFDRVRERTDYT